MNVQSTFLRVFVVSSAAIFLDPDVGHSLVAQEQRWSLSPEPVVQIGVVFGDPAYEFHEIAGAVRLRNGHIVIADGGSKEVRFYNASGGFLKAVGGEGEGPEEILRIFTFRILGGDTVAVYDSRRGRVVKFDQDGQFLQGILISPPPSLPRTVVEHFFVDGGMLGIAPQAARREPGHWVRKDHLILCTGNGWYSKYLGLFAGSEIITDYQDGLGYSQQLPLFGRQSYFATGASHFYHIWTGENIINKYSQQGELVEVFRVDHTPQRVTDRDVRLEREEFVARATSPLGTQVLTSALEKYPPPPDFHNVFGWPAGEQKGLFGPPLLVDDTGNIWLLQYQSHAEEFLNWTVLSEEGEYICDVALPRGLTPFQIGDDFVIGWVSDEDEVEYVRVYVLSKQG